MACLIVNTKTPNGIGSRVIFFHVDRVEVET